MKNTKMRIGPVAEAVLVTIATAGVVSVALCAPNALQMLAPFFKKKKYSPKRAVNRNIDSLISSGLIRKVQKKDGVTMLELTPRGKWEVGIRNFFTESHPKKWDGKWRIVIFDVPNEKDKLRFELTRGMKLYGFKLLQKSVWIFPHPCDDFVLLLRNHLELKDNVTYLTASTFEDDKKFRKEFKV